MRYDVRKFLFAGIKEDRETFFEQAQEKGFIHFINRGPSQAMNVPEEIHELTKAIKILKGLPPQKQAEASQDDADQMVLKILSLKEELEKLAQEEKALKLELLRVEIFATFSQQDIEYIEKEGKRSLQFYCAKKDAIEKLPENVLYVASDHASDYFFGINKESSQYPQMTEMQVDYSWGELKSKHQELLNSIQVKEQSLKGYAKYNQFLRHALVHKLNNYHLESAQNYVHFPIEDSLFFIEGWVPAHKVDALHQLVDSMHVHVEEVALDPKDKMPTYLENKGARKIGEDLTRIYDIPSTVDKDPSLWILVFFSLFFAMIIGDGGYGLLFLIGALYIRYKHAGLQGAKKRFLNLFTILSFAVIVWGVLTSSFFGITIPPDSPLRTVSLMEWLSEKNLHYQMMHDTPSYQEMLERYPQIKGIIDPKEVFSKASAVYHGNSNYELLNKISDNIMMELALFVGVVHVMISLGRNLNRNLAGIGWITFLIGSYLVVPGYLGATSIIHYLFGMNNEIAAKYGMLLIYGGIGIATAVAILQHKLAGIMEPMIVIQIFADVLSYLRLYALGLSGALLTITFNELAGSVNIVFGSLIIIAGHLINMVLGTMSGVIHGLRLNFLEWYHYSFEGGGKTFNPLQKLEYNKN